MNLKQLLATVGLALAWSMSLQAQPACNPDHSQTGTNSSALQQFSNHKSLPQGYEREALIALTHFPELKEVPIIFRFRKSASTLKTRPSFFSFFMPRGHRSYVIIISSKTCNSVKPLMLEHLPDSARIGVLGHELSHVADFASKSSWQSLKTAAGHFSKKYMDSLEYHTDQICISHGLGKELESWSSYIRQTMHTKNWRGAAKIRKGESPAERYMNPSSIEQEMIKTGMRVSATENAH